MTIEIIKDATKSAERNKLNNEGMKTDSVLLQTRQDQTAIDALLHYWEFNCAHTVNNALKIFQDHGTVKGVAAFKHLAYYFTGAKKGEKGEHDAERKNKAANLYMNELKKIDELGLIQWHKERTAIPVSKEEADKKEAKAKAKAREDAEAWIVEEAKTNPIYSAMLKYKGAFVPLFIANPQQATDQLEKDIAGLVSGMAGVDLKKVG